MEQPESTVRTAVSISYNIAGLVGGFVPLIAESLLGGFGASWPLAILLALICAITAGGSFAAMKVPTAGTVTAAG